MENSAPLSAPGRRPRAADLAASLVVFMVALPLCIGIAQACGLPPEAGIITGVVGGLLVGLLAGSPLQVSGPAAGLIVLVIQFLDDAQKAGHPVPEAVSLLGLVVILAGGLQVLAGVCRVGQWFRAVSPAVVAGMLAGIGLSIIAKQFHELVDDDAPKGVVASLLTIPDAVRKGFDPPPGAAANHSAAALVGVLTILVLAVWKPLAPRRLKVVPAAVAGVLLAVAVTEAAGLGVDRVRITHNLLESVRPPVWPGWEVFGSALVWKGAVTFALIASAESLLCAVAVDTMHRGPRTRFDRELVAQGVGNAVAGALGGLPMTGVIVRSSANVDAGAKTRLSAVLHGVWLLLFVSLLPGVLSRIPTSALAAILVYTGWKLVGLPGAVRLWRVSRSEVLIYAATAAAIVGADLLTGVVLGVVLSAAKVLWQTSRLRITRDDEPEHGRIHLVLDGAATFIRLPLISEELDRLPPGRKVHLHLDRVQLVDHAVFELLNSFRKQYEAGGGNVYLDWNRLTAHLRPGDMPSQASPLPIRERVVAT